MARPRAFDLDVATERALHLFWRKGYEGTTLGDLTEAMGINRPSLYAAFGSKEGVFLRALERYVEGPGAAVTAALQAKTGREAAQRMLRVYADAAGRPDTPQGCLLVQGALACGDESQSIRAKLAEMRLSTETALIERLERAKREGDLRADASPTDLGRYIWTVCQGLAVQASGGATREQMRRLAQLAMRAWPE
jgi:AcrR family transcriptional regulator